MKQKLFKDFALFLVMDCGCNKRTTSCHLYRIKKLQRWLRKKPFNLENCKAYLYKRKREGTFSSTEIAYIITIRHWSEFLAKKKLIDKEFGFSLKVPRADHRSPDILTPTEIRKIINFKSTHLRAKNRLRMNAIFVLLAGTGGRLGEILALKVEDVFLDNPKDCYVCVRNSKTGEGRKIPIQSKVARRLQPYVKNKTSGETIFKGRKGRETLTNAAVWTALKTRLKAAGIKKRISPHSFRHSYITTLLRADKSVAKVQRLCGHKLLSTTMGYAHFDHEDLKEAAMANDLTSLIR